MRFLPQVLGGLFFAACGGTSTQESTGNVGDGSETTEEADAGRVGEAPNGVSEVDASAPSSLEEGVRNYAEPPTKPVSKIDLLFMVDNSGGMAQKQEILRLALPDLVQRLVDPVCLDASGVQGPFADPATGECALGYSREFSPIENINVAVISSSLGDAGANSTCPQGQDGGVADMAHTIGSLPRGREAATSDSELGFLQWRPGANADRFVVNFGNMVEAVGERGCGWEGSLESWYRFLADPFPYRALARVACSESDQSDLCVQAETESDGRIAVDEVLLAQRNEFLRPDSLLAIVMLTDENDCSIRVGNQAWAVASNVGQMFRGTSVCDVNPNDKCCHICAVNPPSGCAEDPICDAEPTTGALANRLSSSEDSLNLRCFQQKRRFGLEFLYPVGRYVNALSQDRLCWSSPDLSLEDCPEGGVVNNPLFPPEGRKRSQVVLSGIVGVPHQSLSSPVDALGRPLSNPDSQLRFKTWEELTEQGDWDKILGEVGTPYRAGTADQVEIAGTAPVPPTEPYMVESEFERPGVVDGNSVNGRDWDTTGNTAVAVGTSPREELQYACIFPLAEPQECEADNDTSADFCQCPATGFDKPLCEQIPGTSTPGTLQYWAGAYPATRQLEVLKAFGEYDSNSVVSSICARNTMDATRPDFGFRPAMQALVEGLKVHLPEQ